MIASNINPQVQPKFQARNGQTSFGCGSILVSLVIGFSPLNGLIFVL